MSARSCSPKRSPGPADLFTLHVLTGVAVVLSELGGDSAGSATTERTTAGVDRTGFRPDGSAPEDSAGKPGDGSARSRRLRRSKGRWPNARWRLPSARSVRNTPRSPGACTRWPRSSRGWATMPRPCGCSSAPPESTRRCCSRRIPKSARAALVHPRFASTLGLRLRRHGSSSSGCSRFARRIAVSAIPARQKA